MINHAKVNLLSVRQFKQAVIEIKQFSAKTDSGRTNIEDLIHHIDEEERKLEREIDDLSSSRDELSEKINNIEGKIERLKNKYNGISDRIDELEDQLSYEENENSIDFLENKIDELEDRLESIDYEISHQESRLERAYNLDAELQSAIDENESVCASLSEKKDRCRGLINRFDEVISDSRKKCESASSTLQKAEDSVSKYLNIKMEYDDILGNHSDKVVSDNKGININITVTKNNVVKEEKGANSSQADRESENHKIKYDNSKRVCEYDGKKFGGAYNSYEERAKQLPVNRTNRGYFVGDRGESKYIPSELCAEGIIAKEILASYGLDGIEYHNAEPDFEVCSEGVVVINHMTEDRDSNFEQADEMLAIKWNSEERNGKNDWTALDVYKYRKDNVLSWHEKCDTETMVLVKTVINKYFTHSGGVSECSIRDKADFEGEFDE